MAVKTERRKRERERDRQTDRQTDSPRGVHPIKTFNVLVFLYDENEGL